MDSNQNTFIPPTDCRDTCKTSVTGCTCAKADKKALVTATADPAQAQRAAGSCGGCCGTRKGGCCCGTHTLEVYNWLESLPKVSGESQMVEVQFKNTRKGYYLNSNNIELYRGDIVAVEASPGHDVGEVTLTGKLVQLQMLKNNYRGETKRIYRIAKQNDIEKWEEARKKEHKTMLRAREIAEELKLGMKISDVEYQGDGNKAIFYYIADERVDFRQLIKVYASEFHVKIEMKQIGARQEAGRVGGIGPCGRELCCSSSMSNFVSVSTSAARLQDIPLNPQKLAGQCGKLKCCLNFEVDTYVEAQRKLPSREAVLETKDGFYYHFKTDILSGAMTYSTDKNFAANLVILPKDRVLDVIRMNKRGEKPSHLMIDNNEPDEKAVSHDILQENINRFDDNGNSRNNKKKKFVKNNKRENNKQGNSQAGNNNQSNNKPQGNNARSANNNKPRQQAESDRQNLSQSQGQSRNRNKNNKNRNNKNRSNRNGNPEQKNTEA
jgi:cell fate regulator YaaT (PSP1 superfamily)